MWLITADAMPWKLFLRIKKYSAAKINAKIAGAPTA
jgi:hypothetical protein